MCLSKAGKDERDNLKWLYAANAWTGVPASDNLRRVFANLPTCESKSSRDVSFFSKSWRNWNTSLSVYCPWRRTMAAMMVSGVWLCRPRTGSRMCSRLASPSDSSMAALISARAVVWSACAFNAVSCMVRAAGLAAGSRSRGGGTESCSDNDAVYGSPKGVRARAP